MHTLPTTLLDRLTIWAERQPHQAALVYLDDGDREQDRLDYRSLVQRVDNLASWLAQRVAPGSRVLVAPHSEIHYVVALLACLRANIVAVPTLVPVNARGIARAQAHGEDAGACALLTDAWVLGRRGGTRSGAGWLDGIPWLNVDDADVAVTSTLPPAGADVAYLQYTSGSTNRPKGVMVTHANLAEQLGTLETALDHQSGSVSCNWMPLHHDFGLIMSLEGLYCGGTVVLLPAVPTVQRPRRWLQAISDYKAVTSAAPNFMFDRCCERLTADDCTGLDLSSLRHLLNAAEPIRPATLRAFTERFRGSGFSSAAWGMAYGLAEATLLVSLNNLRNGYRVTAFDPEALVAERLVAQPGGKELVGCGAPLLSGSVSIVDPGSGRRTAPGAIGEIWVANPSVAGGYWNRPAETAETFAARVSGDERPHLRTGDLGFLWEGELYIAGRLKDLIIVRGENHYPQDIELTSAEAHSAIEPNAGAAFALDGPDGESLVVVQEIRREEHRRLETGPVFDAIRHAVAENHGLETSHIVLLKPGGLPRTSSGKVQRRACRRMWEEGTLPVLAAWAASQARSAAPAADADTLEREILDTFRQLLGDDTIDPNISLFEYGVDSMKATDLLLALEERWNVSLDLADFADRSSVTQLAQVLRDHGTLTRPANDERPFYVGDPAGATAAGDGVVAQIRQYVAAWEGEVRSPGGLAVGLNVGGSRSPLFWVFQGHQEFAALAHHLGPDQPVYGMRSGHQVMEYSETNIQTLATHYRREIAAVWPDGPYLLGGNCQGGLIALAIAQQFWRLQRPVTLLSLLEWGFPAQPYLGRLALLWGASSRKKNPHFRFHDPAIYWRRASRDFSIDIVPGGHGEFFSPPNVGIVADTLAFRMREALAVPPLFLPERACRAAFRAVNPPLTLAPGQRYRLEVVLQNVSDQAWAATEHSGLHLGNHWLDANREPVVWLDGAVPLPALPAGASAGVQLPLCAPATPGDYLLQLDLVEEGVAWFSERGNASPILAIRVAVGPGASAG